VANQRKLSFFYITPATLAPGLPSHPTGDNKVSIFAVLKLGCDRLWAFHPHPSFHDQHVGRDPIGPGKKCLALKPPKHEGGDEEYR
jgi:hypothetical protein